MNKQEIINALTQKYGSFVEYINGLTVEEYVYQNQQKWTAAQQLEHLVLCTKPLVKVFAMNKSVIEQTFGQTDRQNRSYEELVNLYFEKLKSGGKAPERFDPTATVSSSREVLCESLTKLIHELGLKIETFTDQELDQLLVPHPLLGQLTLREMLYNTIYHVQHHQAQAQENLKKR